MNTEEHNTPEIKPSDDAVVDAFSKAFDSDEQFRERWRSTVEQAQKRRDERKSAEAERLRAEAEARARQERDARPRVSDEAHPGTPMDLGRLSAIASEKKNAPADDGTPPEDPVPGDTDPDGSEPEGPEPTDMTFNAEAAAQAEERFGGLISDYTPPTSVKDKDIDKKFGERVSFFFKTRFSKDGFRRFAARNFPVKGDNGSEVVRKCVRCASFIALICALGFLVNYFIDFRARINATNAFEEGMSELDNIADADLEDAWAKIRAQYPDIQFPEGMNIKFTELYAINQHVVGWLKIDNTNINTVLLQADNNSYHLRMNIYDEYSRFGNPYVHYACTMGKEGLGKNTILFGHNANDGLMFHDLINYMTVGGYLKSPIVTLDTLYEQTKWKVFAVVLTNSHPSEDNGNVWQYLYPEFHSADHFKQILREIDERTIIHTGVDVNADDKILTLYTCCTYQLDSGRLAVFARQLREGESEDIDESRVYYNQNARYPQTWYDRKDKANPYADPTEAPAGTTASSESTSAPSGSDGAPDDGVATAVSGETPTADTAEPSSEPPEQESPSGQPPAEEPAAETPAAEPPAEGTPEETPADAAASA